MIKFLFSLLLMVLMIICILVEYYARCQMLYFKLDDCDMYMKRAKNFKLWVIKNCPLVAYIFLSIVSCAVHWEELSNDSNAGWFLLWSILFSLVQLFFFILFFAGAADSGIIPFCLPINSLIKTYYYLDKDGTKINFRTFKNIMKVCPENVVVKSSSYLFSYDNKREEFYFDNFISFVRADVLLARRASNKKKKNSVENIAALELMHKAIEDKLNKSLNETKAAAQESIKIINNMER